jgi:hypothetical protein
MFVGEERLDVEKTDLNVTCVLRENSAISGSLRTSTFQTNPGNDSVVRVLEDLNGTDPTRAEPS